MVFLNSKSIEHICNKFKKTLQINMAIRSVKKN